MIDGKMELVKRIGSEEGELFVLISGCTRGPYVVCDEETYDDEVMMFFEEAAAKAEAEKLAGEKIPVTVLKLGNRQMLLFFTNLYTCLLYTSPSPRDA